MKVFIVILSCLIGFTTQWSYDYETQWPGNCIKGQQQSPINIMTRSALLDKHGAHLRGDLVFRGYNSVNLTTINNGHTLKWNRVEKPGVSGPWPTVKGGPLRGSYTFLQFHLHWLSEHAIDGIKYPLEIHMVHIKTGLTTEEALKRPDGLAVIGVMCQVLSDEASKHALEQIMPVVPELIEKNEEGTEPNVIDMTRLFSPEPQSYYTYHGSLTTPNCQESVTWIVMDKVLSISDVHYKQFSKVNIGRINNYRSLQHANRVVYRSIASCSSLLLPSSLSILVTVISCLASNLGGLFSKGFCFVANIKNKVFGGNTKYCLKVVGQ